MVASAVKTAEYDKAMRTLRKARAERTDESPYETAALDGTRAPQYNEEDPSDEQPLTPTAEPADQTAFGLQAAVVNDQAG